jgi:hypothetical protein
MLALDNAFKRALDALDLKTTVHSSNPRAVLVKYASPRRDTAPPFISHYGTDSRPSPNVDVFGQEGRLYEHAILVVHREGVKAEALKERIEAALLYGGARGAGITLAVPGWGTSEPLVWVGDVHDLGDLLVDGTLVPFAGFRVGVEIQRPYAG